MFKVDAVDSYGTSKNNFVNSANYYKELDALTGKHIYSVTQLFFDAIVMNFLPKRSILFKTLTKSSTILEGTSK